MWSRPPRDGAEPAVADAPGRWQSVMNRRKPRVSRTRETRDPAVAASYTQAQEASAEWTLALIAALRAAEAAAHEPPRAVAATTARQLPLPFAEPSSAA